MHKKKGNWLEWGAYRSYINVRLSEGRRVELSGSVHVITSKGIREGRNEMKIAVVSLCVPLQRAGSSVHGEATPDCRMCKQEQMK